MWKWLQKNFYLVIASVLLILLTLFVFSKAEITETLHLCLHSEDYTAELSIYESEEGELYVFLPSYAQMDRLEIVVPKGMVVMLGDVPLTDGMTCEFFSVETPYAYWVDGEYVADLQFYRSANVATMFIETATGSMEEIHEDKNHSEAASITVVTEYGTLDVDKSFASIKGRGQTSWNFSKHPYSLTFFEKTQILEAGSATQWALLANAKDETNLNNYLVMKMAEQLDFEWVPVCVFLDLYLNGEYSGLYLLIEKVEEGLSALNIDVKSGDFLCKIEFEHRWDSLKNPFLSTSGRTVDIVTPQKPSESVETEIKVAVDQMEQIIFSHSDLNENSLFNLDSWVKRYLIDEVFGNIDSDLASSYFYRSDGVIYAGPLWDYDMVMGDSTKNQNPFSFIAKCEYRFSESLPLYNLALYENDSFYMRMVELYRNEFLPLLCEMLEHGIHDISSVIKQATEMNSLRWHEMFQERRSVEMGITQTAEELRSYLEDRVSFLNSAWLDGVCYETVQFVLLDATSYWSISLEKGGLLETDFVDIENTVWIDRKTGEVIDFSEPIETDLVLIKQSS